MGPRSGAAAPGLDAAHVGVRVAVAGELLKNLPDLEDKSAATAEIITALNAEIVNYQRTQPAVAQLPQATTKRALSAASWRRCVAAGGS